MPLLLALVTKKEELDAPDLENCMPRSPTNSEKRASSSLPSIGNLVIVVISKSIGLMVTKGKINPLMKVA